MKRFHNRRLFLAGILVLTCLLPVFAQEGELSASQQPTRGEIANVPEKSPYWGQAVVRSRPDSKSEALGSLQNGTEVALGEMSGMWIKVTAPKVGWVGSNLVKITESGPLDPNTPLTIEQMIYNSKPAKRLKILKGQQSIKPFLAVPVDFKIVTPDPAK